MNTFKINVPLSNIIANTYQPRENEDAEHIQQLALSIAEQGLLQTPVGRLLDADDQPINWQDGFYFVADDHRGVSTETIDKMAVDFVWEPGYKVQLAFGHSRLAAFRFLKDAGNAGFDTLPVVLQDISDEDMFKLAITENIQRKDLTPIEEARAMLRYRTEFGKTSAEIGALFGLSESTVRNKMRLVDLPEEAKTALDDGRLTENAARRLLSVKDVMKGEDLDGLATRLANERFDTPNQVDNAVNRALSNQKNVKTLYSKWSSDKDHADELFSLDWEPYQNKGELKSGQYFEGIGFADVKYFLLEWGKTWKDEKEFRACYEATSLSLISFYLKPEEVHQPKEMVDAIMHLVRPPACSKCPYFIQLDGSGICGRKMCFERKANHWKQLELEHMCQETGIAKYDPEIDGEDFDKPHAWYQSEKDEPWKTWWKEKNADLRLRIEDIPYGKHPFTNSQFIQVISVSEHAREAARRMKEKRAEMDAHEDDWQERQRKAQEQRRAAEEWVYTQAALPFGKFVYGNMKPGVLNILARAERIDPDEQLPEEERTDKKKSEYILSRLGSTLLFPLINRSINFTEGPEAVAKFVAGVAVEIGMPVPDGWLVKE